MPCFDLLLGLSGFAFGPEVVSSFSREGQFSEATIGACVMEVSQTALSVRRHIDHDHRLLSGYSGGGASCVTSSRRFASSTLMEDSSVDGLTARPLRRETRLVVLSPVCAHEGVTIASFRFFSLRRRHQSARSPTHRITAPGTVHPMTRARCTVRPGCGFSGDASCCSADDVRGGVVDAVGG